MTNENFIERFKKVLHAQFLMTNKLNIAIRNKDFNQNRHKDISTMKAS